MKQLLSALTVVGLAGALGAGVAEAGGPRQVRFEVTITNVSELGQLPTDRAGGQIPLSPGVWAVAKGSDNPLFDVGAAASAGIEGVAEDGAVDTLTGEAAAVNRVSAVAPFFGPAGPILTGQSTTFTVTGTPGDRLFLATMFVQSNDFFFANDGGIRLFEGNRPVSGDVTAAIDLWDAGTEVDTAPGTGEFQVLAQSGPNTGPDEHGVVTLATETGDGFDLPANDDVIRVTITPVG
jgi:hypothetical protein